MARAWMVWLVLLAMVSTGCASFGYRTCEGRLRWDREHDEFIWTTIVRGLESDAENSVSAVTELGAGRRRFPAEGGLISIDLDDPRERAEGDEGAPDFEDQLFALLAANVRVDLAGLFVEPDGTLSFFRRTRIAHPDQWIPAINRLIDDEVRNSQPDDVGDFPYFDERSRELFLAHAQRGGQWITFVDGSIRWSAPMTSFNAARIVAEFAAQVDGERTWVAQWAAHLRDLRVADEHFSAVFAPGTGGEFVFEIDSEADGSSTLLRDRVLATGTAVRKDFTVEAARRLLAGD